MANGKRTYNKYYQLKSMQLGERFKIDDNDVRKLQLLTSYYRNQCKRPINVAVVREIDGYYCERLP